MKYKKGHIYINGKIYPRINQYLFAYGKLYQAIEFVPDDRCEYGLGIKIREVFGRTEHHNHKSPTRAYVINVSEIEKLH